jgi:replicative DNA helicase Mcm
MGLEGIYEGRDGERQPTQDSAAATISVSEAARLHQGSITVQGIISAVSPLQKLIKEESWECYYCKTLHYVDTLTIEDHKPVLYKTSKAPIKCKNRQCPSNHNAMPTFFPHYAYTNAIIIELRNIDTFSDIDPLRVVVFDSDTIDVHTHLGEKTTVIGVLHVFRNPKQKAVSYLYSEFIVYESNQEVTISPTDKAAIEKFVRIKGDNAIDCMAAKMFAPDVIGYDIVKKGLLLAAASTNTNTEAKKVHLLLIGDPGTAKSTLLMKSTKLVLNSRYESAQNSSGKSLTAIVEKEDDYNVLRTGALAAAKGAICALNEIARMSFEDQKHLLDSMQEQHFSINKHGMSARIVSPTSVIASANPLYGEWKDSDIIDLDEIQILKPLRDRFDLIFVFRRTKDELSIRNYANKKIDMSDRPVADYNSYLQKHIEYSKRFNPKLSEEAKFMLKEYYIKVAATGHGSPRVLESLIAIAKMIARLKNNTQ